MSDLLTGLNPQQIDAVTAKPGPTLIIAGPVSIFFIARSAGNEKFLHLAVFLALTAIGGVVGSAAANKAAGGAAKAE